MNRAVPEPTAAAVAENKAEEDSRQAVHFTDTVLGLIKRGPTTVEAVRVGEPSLQDPSRTLAPQITKENIALFNAATGRPADADNTAKPTGANEPPRSDRPSEAPVQTGNGEGTGVGVTVVGAPNSGAAPVATSNNIDPTTIGSGTANANDPNALVKPVAPETTAIPAAQAPATAPEQINDIKPGEQQPAPTTADGKQKKPKADLNDESSSKKKKKKGLSKLNPF